MEKAIKIPIIASRINKVKENDETDVVILEICQLKERLENVKSRFNLEEDQDLIEACVYENGSNKCQIQIFNQTCKGARNQLQSYCKYG